MPMRTASGSPFCRADLAVERRQRLEDRQAAMDRAFGVVFLRVRIAKIHQHAVAHELGDKAVEATDSFADQFLIGADHIAHVLGVELGRQTRRDPQGRRTSPSAAAARRRASRAPQPGEVATRRQSRRCGTRSGAAAWRDRLARSVSRQNPLEAPKRDARRRHPPPAALC